MVAESGSVPEWPRRLAAIVSLLIAVAVLGVTIVVSLPRLGRWLLLGVLITLVALSLWYALTRPGRRRALAVAFAVVVLAGATAAVFVSSPVSIAARVVLLVVAGALGRYALARDLRTLKAAAIAGTPVRAATQGALVMNLKSGGGKAEQFHLVEECQRRGIEPIVLTPGDDLLDLARDAIEGGADVIGMAGGDGSQALVAAVAAERGIPMVVVPAGTRNHLALDLGIDRNDVVGALDAFGEAIERPMDLGEVNGRVFVNNVSLGLYATIVQSEAYRDAKVETTLAALPKVLGPGTRPVDLRFDGPDGEHHDGAHMIQVSNGSYGRTMRTMGSRTSVSDGTLGVVSLVIPDDASATRFLGALSVGRPERYSGYQAWETRQLEIDSGGPVAVGLDGETLSLDPPLRFTVRPGVVRLRLSPEAIGHSPAARKLTPLRFLTGLWRVALGQASSLSPSARA